MMIDNDPRAPIWVPVVLPLLYLVSIYFLTQWMEKREAFSMKGVMAVYNCYSTALSAFMCYFLLRELTSVPMAAMWTSKPLGVPSAIFWIAYQSKFIEYTDTIIFVLRKKKDQVTPLHVIHHAEMGPLMWFIYVTDPGNINNAFGPMINAGIHTVMYGTSNPCSVHF